MNETTDTDPTRVALVADAVGAYLLQALDVDTDAWSTFSNEAASGRHASFTHKGSPSSARTSDPS